MPKPACGGCGRPPARYDLLASAWDGSDAALLERMLDFYLKASPAATLDTIVDAGQFWAVSTRPGTDLDIDPRHEPDVVADNSAMPFADGSFDVVVYDPPHVPNRGGTAPGTSPCGSGWCGR